MADLHREVGQTLDILLSGSEVTLRRVEGHYDYAHGDKCRCPVCGDLGVPWGGLFHCENQPHKAVISTGECFVMERDHD